MRWRETRHPGEKVTACIPEANTEATGVTVALSRETRHPVRHCSEWIIRASSLYGSYLTPWSPRWGWRWSNLPMGQPKPNHRVARRDGRVVSGQLLSALRPGINRAARQRVLMPNRERRYRRSHHPNCRVGSAAAGPYSNTRLLTVPPSRVSLPRRPANCGDAAAYGKRRDRRWPNPDPGLP